MRIPAKVLSGLWLLFLPATACALQLTWSSGQSDLSFTEATRCTLIVQTSMGEQRLPDGLQLIWVAHGTDIRPLVSSSGAGQIASVCDLKSNTSADLLARQLTAYLCASGGSAAQAAAYVFILPAGSYGKFMAIGRDQQDPMQVVRSSDATFNSGITAEYPPAIVGVDSDHHTLTAQLHVVGAGLDRVNSAALSSAELGSAIAMSIDEQSESLLQISAEIGRPLSNASLELQGMAGTSVLADVPSDQVLDLMTPTTDAVFQDPDYPLVYPKDFTFIEAPMLVGGEWQRVFHLYYIRNFTTGDSALDQYNTKYLGHAWSRDLRNWTVNKRAFPVGGIGENQWDEGHVWAPSLVYAPNGGYYMFYTGVKSIGNGMDQTIGYAFKSTLDTIDAQSGTSGWQRKTASAHSPAQATNWVSQTHPWQFRDPYIMPCPGLPGRYLLFYTAATFTGSHFNAVGRAINTVTSPPSVDSWIDLGKYVATDYDLSSTGINDLESPHVFPDSAHQLAGQEVGAKYRLMYTKGEWTTAHPEQAVQFNTKNLSAAQDLYTSDWPTPSTFLWNYLGWNTSSPEYGKQATEVVRMKSNTFWAGFDGQVILFRRMVWDATGTNFHFAIADASDITSVDDGSTPPEVGLHLASSTIGTSDIRLSIALPSRQQVQLRLYDVAGRQVADVARGELPAGTSFVTWNGCDVAGSRVGSGIYFARLQTERVTRTLRIAYVQ